MYHLFSFNGEIPWDSVPVMKTTEYPFTKGAYKPLAMGSMCHTDDGIAVRFQSFSLPTDENVQAHNKIAVCIGKEGNGLSVTCTQSGVISVTEYRENAALLRLTHLPEGAVRWFEASDNIGLFWGCEFLIPAELIRENTGLDVACDETFACNMITYNDLDEYFHFGCVYANAANDPSVFYLPDEETAKIL